MEWKETVKTNDEDHFMEVTVKVAVTEAEVVTGPHQEAADKAFEAARTERETAGTLLEGAFDDHLWHPQGHRPGPVPDLLRCRLLPRVDRHHPPQKDPRPGPAPNDPELGTCLYVRLRPRGSRGSVVRALGVPSARGARGVAVDDPGRGGPAAGAVRGRAAGNPEGVRNRPWERDEERHGPSHGQVLPGPDPGVPRRAAFRRGRRSCSGRHGRRVPGQRFVDGCAAARHGHCAVARAPGGVPVTFRTSPTLPADHVTATARHSSAAQAMRDTGDWVHVSTYYNRKTAAHVASDAGEGRIKATRGGVSLGVVPQGGVTSLPGRWFGRPGTGSSTRYVGASPSSCSSGRTVTMERASGSSGNPGPKCSAPDAQSE